MKRHLVVGSLLAVAGATVAPRAIQAGEGDYIGLFGGTWLGTARCSMMPSRGRSNCRAWASQGSTISSSQAAAACSLVSVAINATSPTIPSPAVQRHVHGPAT